MMFVVRSAGDSPLADTVQVKLRRRTPDIVSNGAGKSDFFCVGDPDAAAALRNGGSEIVELRDGWYADDHGGGVAIFGHGRYWEIRDTPFTVTETCGPDGNAHDTEKTGEQFEVRRAIFGV